MGSFQTNSFGTAIPVQGPNVGYIGQISRSNPRGVRSRQVLPASTYGLPFGAPTILISDATNGKYQSVAEFLGAVGSGGSAANAQYIRARFAGIAGREVKQQLQYTSLYQNSVTPVSTTGTASSGSTSLTVASATGIAAGQSVVGAGIAPNTYVSSISGTTVTLSQATIAALSSTTVNFIPSATQPSGIYNAGDMADALLEGSATVQITTGTPDANGAVFIRTVANASTPGTSVGDLEATDELATSSITIGTTIGSTTLTTSAGTGLAIGQRVVSPYFPEDTYLVSGSGTSWVTSRGALATVASGGVASFYNTALLSDSLGLPWIVFSTGQIDENGVAEITLKVRHSA